MSEDNPNKQTSLRRSLRALVSGAVVAVFGILLNFILTTIEAAFWALLIFLLISALSYREELGLERHSDRILNSLPLLLTELLFVFTVLLLGTIFIGGSWKYVSYQYSKIQIPGDQTYEKKIAAGKQEVIKAKQDWDARHSIQSTTTMTLNVGFKKNGKEVTNPLQRTSRAVAPPTIIVQQAPEMGNLDDRAYHLSGEIMAWLCTITDDLGCRYWQIERPPQGYSNIEPWKLKKRSDYFDSAFYRRIVAIRNEYATHNRLDDELDREIQIAEETAASSVVLGDKAPNKFSQFQMSNLAFRLLVLAGKVEDDPTRPGAWSQ